MSMLSPSPKFSATFVDADGYTQPAVGYKLNTYAAGTSTPKATYTSYTLGAQNTNPVILDARGEADVWLSGNYKFILTDPDDVTVWTVDNVNDLETGATFTTATLAGALTVTSTAVTWSGNPTHSGNHTFSGNVVINGNTTLGDAGADTLTVNPNAVTWANNPTHSGNHTWSGTSAVNGLLTLGAGAIIGNVANAGTTVLDWYEEGTFTPVLSFGGATTGITYSTQTGRYVRIGKIVHIAICIILSSKGSASGVASISGLPFSTYASQQLINCHFYNMTGLAAPMIMFTSGGAATLLPYTTALATGTPSSADETDFTNVSDIWVNSWYEVV
jgi:hypothetical protein